MGTWKGLAVPLNGEATVNGEITFDGGLVIGDDERITFDATVTTAPSTGLTKGDMFLIFSTSSPVLAVCTSTAANTLKYLSPFDTKTLGRVT